MDDMIELLDAAVEAAAERGYPASGWTLMSGEDGYVGWVYYETDEGVFSVFDEVDAQLDALTCAKWVLKSAQELPKR